MTSILTEYVGMKVMSPHVKCSRKNIPEIYIIPYILNQ